MMMLFLTTSSQIQISFFICTPTSSTEQQYPFRADIDILFYAQNRHINAVFGEQKWPQNCTPMVHVLLRLPNKYRDVHTTPRYFFFPYISHFSHTSELKSSAEKVKNDLPAGLCCVSIKLSFVYQGVIVWIIEEERLASIYGILLFFDKHLYQNFKRFRNRILHIFSDQFSDNIKQATACQPSLVIYSNSVLFGFTPTIDREPFYLV